ncbi:hypothetical protein HanRHA438_Chr05g0227991 [Helianthus annuus]|nr:hypothetical protein HanRHA438_Chr05g0227991 [Helianthus annuus]
MRRRRSSAGFQLDGRRRLDVTVLGLWCGGSWVSATEWRRRLWLWVVAVERVAAELGKVLGFVGYTEVRWELRTESSLGVLNED